jgi:Cu(I)/Ag(I) efflux system membrane fusion protein
MKMLKQILLLLSLYALLSCRNADTVKRDPDIYYTCSMDPQVVEYKPGTCPICKMDLTPVRKSTGIKADEIQLSDQQLKLGNIMVDTIREGRLGDGLVLTATLNFDQMKTTSISARIMGRIEKLYHKNIGDYVQKGTPLYDLYSEELYNAKQEFLLALDQQKEFKEETVIDYTQLVEAARNKLLLWGLTKTQVDNLAQTHQATPVSTILSSAGGYITSMDTREGDYVMEGGTIVNLADMQTLWAEAQVYTSQLPLVDRNSMATVQLPDMEGREIRGRIEFVNPEINPDTRINLLRVSISNPGNQLKPGMPAYVLLKSPDRRAITLPIDAVIRDGRGASVWMLSGNNTFKSVMVRTGLETDNQIEILSGLKKGDMVVTSGAYLLHSEFIFKKGADPMAAHNH